MPKSIEPVSQRFIELVTRNSRHFPLTSVVANLGGENNVGRAGFVLPPRTSVIKQVLHGGRQEGVEVVDIDNGKITIRVVPTRGMEIWDVRKDDIIFGMNSPVSGEIVHPSYMDPHGYGGLGWALNGFGAFFNRCGLHSASNPGPDTVISNTGDKRKVDLPLHGEINRIPASEVWLTVDKEPPYRLMLHSQVKEWKMFGQKLTLESKLITEVESNCFTLEETIINCSSKPTEMMTMFHINVGEPVLDRGAEFVGNFIEIEPRDNFAGEGNWRENVHKFGPSVPGYIEKVFYGKLATDVRGMTGALLKNSRGNLGVSISYPTRSHWDGLRGGLPYYTHWVNLDTDARNVAFEPGTNHSKHRGVERDAGRLIVLEPGEGYAYDLHFGFHTEKSDVDRVAELILKTGK